MNNDGRNIGIALIVVLALLLLGGVGMMGFGGMGIGSGMIGGYGGYAGMMSAEFSAATTAHRFRVVNGSDSRVYKLAWEDETPMLVFATNGGLLEKAVHDFPPYRLKSRHLKKVTPALLEIVLGGRTGIGA